MKKIFNNWNLFEISWLLIANLMILGLSLYWGDNFIAIISAITGVTSVILVSKQMISNYFFGIINVSLYAFLAFQSKLYGDVMLNALYYLPMQFIGLYMWNKAKKSDNGEVKAKILGTMARVKLALSSLVAIFIYSMFLRILGGNIPFFDATSTVLSVIAMILMVKQYTEQWHLWIIVNIVSIIMWVFSIQQGLGDMATLLMWIVYLLNSLFGLINWKRASKR